MTFRIRPFDFTDADYRSAVDLRHALYADTPTTAAIWKHNDSLRRRDPSYHFFVAEVNEGPTKPKMIGYVQCARVNEQSQTFGMGMVCLPMGWEMGVADALLGAVIAAAKKFQATDLLQKIQESDQQKLTFFREKGFKPVMHYPLSTLDLSRFDRSRFADHERRVADSGISVSQLPENWREELAWQKRVYDLDWHLVQDVPSPETRVKEPFDTFVKNELFHPNAYPESYFVAWDRDLPVGLTCFIKRGGQIETVSTSLTGVVATHRRRGIAYALKLASIQFAQQAGVKIILTRNEEDNPMVHLNRRLGFVKNPAWIDFKLRL